VHLLFQDQSENFALFRNLLAKIQATEYIHLVSVSFSSLFSKMFSFSFSCVQVKPEILTQPFRYQSFRVISGQAGHATKYVSPIKFES